MTSTEALNLTMGRRLVPRTEVFRLSWWFQRCALACQLVNLKETDSEVSEHLRLGTAKVRDVIGPEVSITDREIEDSLWHYYYDVDKTVNYLLGMTQQTVN